MKAWFSLYDYSLTYKGNEPHFFEPNNYEWAKDVMANFNIINEELLAYLKTNDLESYFSTSMVNRKNVWRTISIRTWSVRLFKNQKHFPKTTALIDKYPNIVSASFNLLEANSNILPHCGDTNAIFRCHLGLSIPGQLPEIGFRVGDEKRSWEQGKMIIFVDAHNHEAWNKTRENRYIFLFDVVRDEFAYKKKWICSTVLTSLFLQKRVEKNKLLQKLPIKFFQFISPCFVPFIRIGLWAANAFKIF